MTLEEKLKEIIIRNKSTMYRVYATKNFKTFEIDEKFVKEHIALAKALELAYKNIGVQCGCTCSECKNTNDIRKQIKQILDIEK